MKCNRCGRQISEDQTYTYQGQALCEDCRMEIGLHPRGCEPWATYLATRAGAGSQGLTELQKKVHDFVKSKGKATRAEVKKHFSLSEAEMDAQLTPLLHSELVKERSEGDESYLVPIERAA